jgi:hypothetical protein
VSEMKSLYSPWYAIAWRLVWFIPVYTTLILLCLFIFLG